VLTCFNSQVRDELNHEALQFVKEQRIRCLLSGSWFPQNFSYSHTSPESGPVTKTNLNRNTPLAWRFVRLSHNRRYLHYADFDSKDVDPEPKLEILREKIDLSTVSSVVSNVSASTPTSSSSADTVKEGQQDKQVPHSNTRITIHGYVNHHPNSIHGHKATNSSATATTAKDGAHHTRNASGKTGNTADTGVGTQQQQGQKEQVLLQLHPQTHTLASEWLDGLLMLLNQQPITADTNKLVNVISGYGLKIRLLNVRFEDLATEEPTLPTREGLDEEYFYDIGGMETG
jgi:engulfment and cell motility protein 1